jgi:hypothetical protein
MSLETKKLSKAKSGDVSCFLVQRNRLKSATLDVYGKESVEELKSENLDVDFLKWTSEETIDAALDEITSNWNSLFAWAVLIVIGLVGSLCLTAMAVEDFRGPLAESFARLLEITRVCSWALFVCSVICVAFQYDSGRDCAVLNLDSSRQVDLIQKVSKDSSVANAYREAVLSNRRLRLFDVKVMQVLSKREAYTLMHPMIDDRKMAR